MLGRGACPPADAVPLKKQEENTAMENAVIYGLFTIISFGASVVGAICGIGGGVLIKPLLDAFGVMSVSAISFLSGCTVLTMSCYSVVKSRLSGDSLVDLKTGTPLAIGAAIGGIVGKSLFQSLSGMFSEANKVGAVQAVCLLVITLGTMIYTVRKNNVRTLHLTKAPVCTAIGFLLGILSSFLGIGGGPINLVVLYYFFSMDTKTAAQNSLYIILFSQLTSFFMTVFTRTVPDVSVIVLVLMVLGGLLGGIAGRRINRRIGAQMVEKLFVGLMAIIILICIYNAAQFMYSKSLLST